MTRTCRHKAPPEMLTTVRRLGDPAGDVYRNDDGTPVLVAGDAWYARGICPFGGCVELRCPVCGCVKMGWGPVNCPCTWRGDYPAMQLRPHHAAVKPSLLTSRRIRRRKPA